MSYRMPDSIFKKEKCFTILFLSRLTSVTSADIYIYIYICTHTQMHIYINKCMRASFKRIDKMAYRTLKMFFFFMNKGTLFLIKQMSKTFLDWLRSAVLVEVGLKHMVWCLLGDWTLHMYKYNEYYYNYCTSIGCLLYVFYMCVAWSHLHSTCVCWCKYAYS